MGTIPLPINQSSSALGALIEVINTGTGQMGIMGWAGGSDQFGDTGTGVVGETDVGTGVQGIAESGQGVSGISVSGPGVYGQSTSNCGIVGVSQANDAINGTTAAPSNAGVSANNTSPQTGQVPSGYALSANSNNTAVYAQGNPAGYFAGDVLVTGDLVLLNFSGADIAEDFDVENEHLNSEPGTVLIITNTGRLSACDIPYDTRVAGVVSGAAELKPAVVLQRMSSEIPRSPIALLGKVFCKVDATSGNISPGDLLTTSATPGYAMKAADRSQAPGAILGKALARLDGGLGLIPIMVTLR